MANGNIDPPTGSKYVLEGRVVTMGTPELVPQGAIYVEAGEIKAVQPAAQPAPAGFEEAPRIRTGDTIYPGLIELHNHLCYNAMPLWDVPRRYSNNGQWKNHEDYRRLITKPSQVLGRTPGVVEALVRFVECRSLLGGVTTSQGITLSSAPGIRAYYKGIVRNVEQPDDPRLPHAGTRIANPATGEAQAYLENLQGETCWLQHMSEGVDATARGWFLRLQLDSGNWALADAFCGIHSTALLEEEFRTITERGGSIVWSPLSNYLLYGQTVNLQAAKEAGILMGLGSDWAPSGSKNLLGELKVAWLASLEQSRAFATEEIVAMVAGSATTVAGQDKGGVFTPKELVAMATINAARILKWDTVLGSIEPGKRADFVVVNGHDDDDYMHLIEARETSVTLVVIDGVARVGQKRLMRHFGPGTEEIKVGRSTRVLNLAQDSAHPLVRDLTLAEATSRLEEAMQNLPALAERLDSLAAGGLFGGSVDAQGTAWSVFLDLDEGEDDLELAAQPLAFYVEEMHLDGITVPDDPGFLSNLVAARNLPEFAKKGLPPLYGQEIPLPTGARFLQDVAEEMAPQVLDTTTDLKTFLNTWGELTLEELKMVVDQALLLLEQNYVHLPFKRAMHAVDPIQRLRLLRHRLEEIGEGELPPEIEFHNELVRIFNSLRDLHTAYRLPLSFRGKAAWLPFTIEEFWEHDHRKYMVSKIVGKPGPDSFEEGVEVLYWNGMPIERAIAQNAERQAGSNEAARHARGLNSLTIRPLAQGLPPDEEWVTLQYRDLGGEIQQYTQEWLVLEPGRGLNSIDPESTVSAATALGVDPFTDDVQEAKRVLYAGKIVLEETRAAEGEKEDVLIRNTRDGVPTRLPTVFRAKPIPAADKTFGYIRIFTFNVADADVFVDEFVRLTGELPPDGLIVDVRGNGGGLIHAAERLLQVLTPRRIEPERAQFINSPVNLQICRNHAPSARFRDFSLESWIRSIEQSVATGATYSLGFPITDPGMCNDIGQRYYGPVLLITDALCYSATDMFAAGFQDHEIGPILGTSENTGAGGANVWSHAILRQLMEPIPGSEPALSPYVSLPRGADLRVAVRRTVRVGPNAGNVVEDLGITPDRVHRMTRRDLLRGNIDLIEEATSMLASQETHNMGVNVEARDNALPRLDVVTHNVNRLDVLLDGRPLRTLDVEDGLTFIDLQEIVGDVSVVQAKLELRAFDDDELAIVYRRDLSEL